MQRKKSVALLILFLIFFNIFTLNVYGINNGEITDPPFVNIVYGINSDEVVDPPFINIHDKYQEQFVWVSANSGLNFREYPNLKAEIIKTIPYGTKIIRLKKNIVQGWDLVLYQNKKAYVFNKYLTNEQINNYYMGKYRITFYCGCSKCNGKWTGQPTASGVYPKQGITIATGREFSFGTKIMINNHIYTVQDRGVPNGCIDIYLNSHQECYRRGLYYTDIYLIKSNLDNNN